MVGKGNLDDVDADSGGEEEVALGALQIGV